MVIKEKPKRGFETWFIAGGSAALYTFLQPGVYAYVNHNLIEAEQLGATAHVLVEGEWNEDRMKQVAPPPPHPVAGRGNPARRVALPVNRGGPFHFKGP